MAKCSDIIKRYRTWTRQGMSALCRSLPENHLRETWQLVARGTVKGDHLRELLMSLLHCADLPAGGPDPGACCGPLLAVVSAKGRTKKMRNVMVQIFEELGPYLEVGLVDAVGLSGDPAPLVHMLDALLVAGLVPLLETVAIDKLTRVLEDLQSGPEEKGKVVAFLCRAVSRYPGVVSARHVSAVSRCLSGWLQVPAASSVSSGRLDRAPAATRSSFGEEIFTVLSQVGRPTASHLVSVYAFSNAREWLMQLDRLHGDSPGEEVSALLDAVCLYCKVAVEQCLRPASEEDASLHKAVLCEVVEVMWQVAELDPRRVPQGVELARRIHSVVGARFRSDYQDVSVLTLSLRFLLHFDADERQLSEASERFLSDTVYRCYSSGLAAWHVASLLCRDGPRLARPGLLHRFHPNLLKLVACHPSALVEEFLRLVPHFTSAKNAVQVWDSLVDLPVLSATLLLHQAPVFLQLEPGHGARATWGELAASVRDPRYQPAYAHVLRREGAAPPADPASMRGYLALMEGVSNHMLVSACCQVTPLLLDVFLDTVEERADPAVVSELLAAMLARLSTVYNAPGYPAAISKLVSQHVLCLGQLCPEVVLAAQPAVVAFLSVLSNASSSPDLYARLVWLVGEFTSPHHSAALSSYYECVECCLYESLGQVCSQQPPPCRLLSVMCSALAKLSARSEDLIPRVTLCLRKVVAQVSAHADHEGSGIVRARVHELLSILRNPTIASSVLSSCTEAPVMTAVLRTITQLNSS